MDATFNNWKFTIEILIDKLELLEFVQKPVTEMVTFVRKTRQARAERDRNIAALQKKDSMPDLVR
jgi:hypothetical protein